MSLSQSLQQKLLQTRKAVLKIFAADRTLQKNRDAGKLGRQQHKQK